MGKQNESGTDPGGTLGFPPMDLHVHLEEFGLERALELSRERGVTFGIVEHGGPGQTVGNDDALRRYVRSLDPHPVRKGLQAEGLDWMTCFSKEALPLLDYVLSDALTFPEKDGRAVHLWRPEEVEIADKQDFMDRYVDFNVRVMSGGIHIMASPTFLPDCLAEEYDALWTEERMTKIIDAAVQHGVAIEISARYDIPSAAFIRMAKQANARFSFGTNSHGEDAGKLDYCLKMAEECGLTRADMFLP